MKKHAQHKQQVRIIGGTHRRSVVAFHEAEGLRPTPERVREQVFNWLGQQLHGQRVLDLFGGSGVMGMEAASRGAAHTDIVEADMRTARQIEQCVLRVQLPNIKVHRSLAERFLQDALSEPYDVVFIDPPYRWQDWQTLWALLSPVCHEDSRVYIEAAELPLLPPWLMWLKQGHAGLSHYGLAAVQAVDL